MATPQLLVPLSLAALATVALDPARDGEVPDLTEASFGDLRARIVPAAIEPWQTIPWRIELLAAREESLATGKPLFLWSMNGHPLGCT